MRVSSLIEQLFAQLRIVRQVWHNLKVLCVRLAAGAGPVLFILRVGYLLEENLLVASRVIRLSCWLIGRLGLVLA